MTVFPAPETIRADVGNPPQSAIVTHDTGTFVEIPVAVVDESVAEGMAALDIARETLRFPAHLVWLEVVGSSVSSVRPGVSILGGNGDAYSKTG